MNLIFGMYLRVGINLACVGTNLGLYDLMYSVMRDLTLLNLIMIIITISTTGHSFLPNLFQITPSLFLK